MSRLGWLLDFRADVRQALRLLRKERGFAASVILTLALGIGANTAIFSVVDAALLRRLPFPGGSRIAVIYNTSPSTNENDLPIAAADYYDFRSGNRSFEEIGLVRFKELYSLTAGTEPEAVIGNQATSSLFRVLGVTPWAGRLFTSDEEVFGKDQVVLLSYGLWKRRFGANPSVLGTRVLLGGAPKTVVGILPPDFEFPERAADIWVPLAPPAVEIQRRFQHRYQMYGLVKSGTPLARAAQDITAINNRLKQEHPQTNGYDVRVLTFSEQRTAASKTGLWILMAAVTLVLVIACANVASLVLARATTRQREIAIRAALGASRSRVLRQVLTESLMLSVAGGLAGVIAAYWSVRSLASWLPASLPGRDDIRLDFAVLAFAVAVSVLTGVLVGLSPALHTARVDASDALRQRSNSSGRGSLRMRSALVITEVAVSVLLLVGGGLLVRSFLRVLGTDSGIDPRNVLTMRIALSRARYTNPAQVNRFYDDLLRGLGATPGVQKAAIVNVLPLSGARGTGPMSIEGKPTAPADSPIVDWRPSSADYCAAMGIGLVSGRGIEESDTAESLQVAVIDDKVAARYWPHENPIGRRVKLGASNEELPWLTIAGVVHTVRHDGLERESRGQVYRPYRQYAIHGLPYWNYTLVLRTAGPAQRMANAARHAILEVDHDQVPFEVRTMEEVLGQSVAPRRFQTLLVGAFAVLALILSSLGLYAVIAYSVPLQIPEIGMRMALGATSRDIVRMVGGKTARLTVSGIVLGLGAAALMSRPIQSQLYGIDSFDLASFTVSVVVIALVAAIASIAPMRRAISIDPARALTAEH